MKENRCKYFNGTVNEVCEKGVRYNSFRPLHRPYQLPCFSDEESSFVCEKREFPTREEIRKEQEERDNWMREWKGLLSRGLCPQCKQVMEKRKMGRCVYAWPCGHRLYQVEI